MKTLKFALVFLTLALGSSGAFARSPEPAVVSWDTPEGIQRLERSRHKRDFFALANQFQNQTNRVFCAPTAAAIVLNALRLGRSETPKPVDSTVLEPRDRAVWAQPVEPVIARYTPSNFFTSGTDTIKTRPEVFGKAIGGKPDLGIQLRQLSRMLEQHGLKSTLQVVTLPANKQTGEIAKHALATMRESMASNLSRTGDFVIVNYFRPVLGQKGGGHVSPLGAYDEASDSFLILDVNSTTAPWVWVSSQKLFQAMNTRDISENRGFLLVSDGR